MGNSAHVHVTPCLLTNPASHSSTDQFQSVLAHYLSFIGNFVVPGQSSLRLYAFVRTDAGFRTDLLKYCGFLPHPEHNPHDGQIMWLAEWHVSNEFLDLSLRVLRIHGIEGLLKELGYSTPTAQEMMYDVGNVRKAISFVLSGVAKSAQ